MSDLIERANRKYGVEFLHGGVATFDVRIKHPIVADLLAELARLTAELAKHGTPEDSANYCAILTALGMEEEGDPVAEVRRLTAEVERLKDEAKTVDGLFELSQEHGKRLTAAFSAQQQRNAELTDEVERLTAEAQEPCEDCDHGIRGGIPCESCGGVGTVTYKALYLATAAHVKELRANSTLDAEILTLAGERAS